MREREGEMMAFAQFARLPWGSSVESALEARYDEDQ
jgi:hypothetical protein